VDAFEKDMLMRHVSADIALNRPEWKKLIHVSDSKKFG